MKNEILDAIEVFTSKGIAEAIDVDVTKFWTSKLTKYTGMKWVRSSKLIVNSIFHIHCSGVGIVSGSP